MNSLEFIKQHVTELPLWCTKVILSVDGKVCFSGGCNNLHDFRADDFAPSYYDGKVWTREEFEACGKPTVEYRFNDKCANPLLKSEFSDYYYYLIDSGKWQKYDDMPPRHWDGAVKISDNMVNNYIKQGVITLNESSIDATVEDFEASVSNNKYERELTDRQGNSATIDVYDVLQAFNVTCPATQHAVKKLLCTGVRGHKDGDTDLLEAREAITRAIELRG